MAGDSVSITVVPASGERFDDLAAVLRPKREGASACWCVSYRLPGRQSASVPERDAYMRGLCESDQPPGVLAYVDGAPVGWCSVSPRAGLSRLVNSRTIPNVDERPVWSVICFVVRSGYRRRGVAAAMLDGAVEYARSQGAETIEGYPLDAEGAKISSTFAYAGTVAMFERAGFTRAAPTTSSHSGIPRWVMRRELGAGSSRAELLAARRR
jgi:GNAT superfamily N-acetyltransferase